MHQIKKEIGCYKLDRILDNYNWDDGFELPLKLIHHPNCDLGTALKAFYLAEGLQYLQDKTLADRKPKEWIHFLKCLYEKITNGDYSGKFVEFKVPLTKVQKYKLLKAAPDTPEVFLKDITGSRNAERCEQCAFGGDTVKRLEGEYSCIECGETDSLAGEIDGIEYSLRCKKCGAYNVTTTIFRPCYVNDSTPREEFSKYEKCRFRA